MDMHRQLLMRKDDQISRHHRGEDMGHYATGEHASHVPIANSSVLL